ncbi:MAG: 50S ribosomal protein L24e [Haloarculaceae archaeon]
MPQTNECDFCGGDVEPGTGTMFVRTDGTTVRFCSSKCEKNADLGRRARDLEWTSAGEDRRVAAEPADDEGETQETAVEPAEETETESADEGEAEPAETADEPEPGDEDETEADDVDDAEAGDEDETGADDVDDAEAEEEEEAEA